MTAGAPRARPRDRAVDVLVVGAGPAGLSAASQLAHAGIRVEVLDREHQAGGVPRHCLHTGYGLRDLHRVLTGPQYARRLLDAARDAGATVRAAATVTGWGEPTGDGTHLVEMTGPAGLERITADAVVLATGARERPRAARLVPGDRPAGVYTTGELQQAAMQSAVPIGRRAVVVGAEHVSYSALVTLGHAGVRVVAMVTDLPGTQTFPVFAAGALLRFGVRPVTCAVVTRVIGRERVEAVELRHADGRRTRIGCDTVVFTGDWIPDHELARRGRLVMDRGTRGPVVGPGGTTSVPGLFAAGNLVHPVATADVCALGARAVATAVREHLSAGPPSGGVAVAVAARPPLRWVVPQRVQPSGRPPDRFLVWADSEVIRPVLRAVQAGGVLYEQPLGRVLVPRRTVAAAAGWVPAVDPDAGPVTLSLS